MKNYEILVFSKVRSKSSIRLYGRKYIGSKNEMAAGKSMISDTILNPSTDPKPYSLKAIRFRTKTLIILK